MNRPKKKQSQAEFRNHGGGEQAVDSIIEQLLKFPDDPHVIVLATVHGPKYIDVAPGEARHVAATLRQRMFAACGEGVN